MSELKPPPNNPDAENAVLGAVLIDGNLFSLTNEKLIPNDFYTEAHQIVFNTMRSMYNENIPIDILSISDQLNKKGLIEKVGGTIHLTYLIDMTPTTANVEHYIKLVKEASDLRQTYDFSRKLIQDIDGNCLDALEAKNVLENFVSDFHIYSDSDEIIQLSKQPPPEPQEWILEGLIPKGYPTTIYASGGVGKSLFSAGLGLHVSNGSKEFIGRKLYPKALKVLFIDYELDRNEIMRSLSLLYRGIGLQGIPDNFYYNTPSASIPKRLESLKSDIKRYDIDLVIVDSIGASGLDAMDEKAVIYIYNKLKELRVTSIIIDHQSKMQTQDTQDNKSPFGSVYKFNMSRSVIHLITDNYRKGLSRIRVAHNKNNFGAKSPSFLVDISFSDETVVIEKSDSLTQEDQQLYEIRSYMLEQKTNGEELNQAKIIEHFQGMIGKDKIRTLLENGINTYWTVSRGMNNSHIYDAIVDV